MIDLVVVTDEIVQLKKGAPVMSQGERAEVVASCSSVDAVLLDTPWVPPLAYLAAHHIDFIIGDEDCRLLYAEAVAAGKFKVIPKTEGAASRLSRDHEEEEAWSWGERGGMREASSRMVYRI